MNQTVCHYGSYATSNGKIPVPEQLKDKDKRADTAARVAVLAAVQTLEFVNNIDLTALNIVVVNREGCTAHIRKVSNGIANHQPAQGYFVRSGPQTLATYTALALGAHGAAFTFVGDNCVLSEATSTALYLTQLIPGSATLLIVVAKKGEADYQADSVLIRQIENSNKLEQEINNHLSRVFT
ncbi:MAG: hypothetical protein KDF59_08195 [Nitrosomonas sp.]|nr:hypothetical protein [Nitrosomonas sp.]